MPRFVGSPQEWWLGVVGSGSGSGSGFTRDGTGFQSTATTNVPHAVH